VAQPASPRPGPFRILIRIFLLLAAVAMGILAWDVWQLRLLRPPVDDRFEAFVAAGRTGSLSLDAPNERLYWSAPPVRTVMRYSGQPLFVFDRAGNLVNWTPGGNVKGMKIDVPLSVRGIPVTLEDARAWMAEKK
jgi:hypothetical protein